MTQTHDTTLMTKVLQPRRRDDVLTRQRLLNRLYDMIDYRLVLVSAPAGYGKSTLLVDFADDLEHPVCWYALDAGDQDPYLFLERLVLSLQRRFPGFGTQTLRALAAANDLRDGAPGLVRVLVNEVVETVPQWFVLVLDDYHTLGLSPEVDAIISNFVTYQRDQCMTIISSRAAPELPGIITLVARGGVGGIGQEEMRFEIEEIKQLFAHNYDVDLSEEEARELAEQSEGWVTGLLLTAYTRWQGVLQSWMRARDSNQPIYDYLTQEVFRQQPSEIQAFLTLSSTLKEMTPMLCEEILGVDRAADLLDTVEDENLFIIRLEGEEDWYRYHHLFREFLQNHLKADDHDLWRRLHKASALWFEAHGDMRLAVDHYLQIEDFPAAAKLMATAARKLYVTGQLATLLNWRRRLPVSVLETVPRLALFQSRAAHNSGDYETALSLSEVAERGYARADDIRGVAYARLKRCESWLSQGRTAEALALGQSVLVLLQGAESPALAEAHRMVGRAYADQGQLETARRELETALEASLRWNNEYDVALARTGLAHVIGLQGAFEAALQLHRDTVAVWRRLGSDAALAEELNDLGCHLYKLGTYDEAMRCYREALAISRQTGLRRIQMYLAINLSELARDLGLSDVALAYGEQAQTLARQLSALPLEVYSIEALGLAYRVSGEQERALALLEKALSMAEMGLAGYEVSRCRASRGVAMAEKGQVDTGLRDIATAVDALQALELPLELLRARFLKAWALYLADRRVEAVELFGELLDTVTGGEGFGEGGSSARLPAEDRSRLRVLVAEGQLAGRLLRAAQKAYQTDDSSRIAQGRARILKEILRQGKSLKATGADLFPQAPTTQKEEGPALRAFGFGDGRVELGGEEIPPEAWDSAAARNLLFYMLINGSSTREQISEAFWPELSVRKAKATFHTTKFRLHQAVGRDVIGYDGRAYALLPEHRIWFDVAEFREHLRAGRQGQDVEVLTAAMELYTADFLTGCYADWCERERDALHVAGLEVLETLADRFLTRRQYRRAIQALTRALALDPTREVFHRQLMRAYALSGQRSRALSQYKRCEMDLRTGLNAQPSQRTVDLYHKIMTEAPLE